MQDVAVERIAQSEHLGAEPYTAPPAAQTENSEDPNQNRIVRMIDSSDQMSSPNLQPPNELPPPAPDNPQPTEPSQQYAPNFQPDYSAVDSDRPSRPVGVKQLSSSIYISRIDESKVEEVPHYQEGMDRTEEYQVYGEGGKVVLENISDHRKEERGKGRDGEQQDRLVEQEENHKAIKANQFDWSNYENQKTQQNHIEEDSSKQQTQTVPSQPQRQIQNKSSDIKFQKSINPQINFDKRVQSPPLTQQKPEPYVQRRNSSLIFKEKRKPKRQQALKENETCKCV